MFSAPDWTLYREITLHLAAALLAGGLIGFERSFHGRPAGFRTHTLVCLASSLLMLVTLYQSHWFSATAAEVVRVDPTRMAQGIMTGIGFLGAGVIFKEGLSVRGLTTAASIWITSAIGVLMGIGFFFAGFLTTALTLGVLALFRHIELRMPTHHYAQLVVRFREDGVMPEPELRALLAEHGFDVANLSYAFGAAGSASEGFEYRMMVRTMRAPLERLAETLSRVPAVTEFRLSPTGD